MLGALELTLMSYTPNRALRVLVVTNVKAYRDALVAALEQRDRIAAFSQDVDSAISTGESLGSTFDVILVDAAAPGALTAIVHLRRCALPVIAFGAAFASVDIMAWAEAGAAGYAPAESSIDDLVSAIFAAVSGELVCSPKVAYDLFRLVGSARANHVSARAEFTPREHQILLLLNDGLSNKEIARSLGIAVSTVKNHVHHILEKCEASSRKHAARKSRVLLAAPPDLHARAEDLVPFMLAT